MDLDAIFGQQGNCHLIGQNKSLWRCTKTETWKNARGIELFPLIITLNEINIQAEYELYIKKREKTRSKTIQKKRKKETVQDETICFFLFKSSRLKAFFKVFKLPLHLMESDILFHNPFVLAENEYRWLLMSDTDRIYLWLPGRVVAPLFWLHWIRYLFIGILTNSLMSSLNVVTFGSLFL